MVIYSSCLLLNVVINYIAYYPLKHYFVYSRNSSYCVFSCREHVVEAPQEVLLEEVVPAHTEEVHLDKEVEVQVLPLLEEVSRDQLLQLHQHLHTDLPLLVHLMDPPLMGLVLTGETLMGQHLMVVHHRHMEHHRMIHLQ